MTVHLPHFRVFLSYAIVAAYLTAILALVTVMGYMFVQEGGSLPLWLQVASLATAFAAWPLSKVTDRMLKH